MLAEAVRRMVFKGWRAESGRRGLAVEYPGYGIAGVLAGLMSLTGVYRRGDAAAAITRL